MPERKTGSEQLIARYPQARLLWDVANNAKAGIDIGGELRAYSINGRVVIIHEYQGGHGWTAYIDPFTTLGTDDTFKAISKHVGLDEDPTKHPFKPSAEFSDVCQLCGESETLHTND